MPSKSTTQLGQAVDLTDIAQTFPLLQPPIVSRDHLLDQIDTAFDDGVDLVLIDGPEQIGKTVLLSQWSRKHCERTISHFLRPISELSFDPSYVRFDLCNQIHWLMRGTTLPADAESGPGLLRTYWMALARALKKGRDQSFAVVMDGLADIPNESQGVREELYKLLPVAFPGYRVLLSGTEQLLGNHTRKGLKYRTLQVPPFSNHEVEQYFADVPSLQSHLTEIRNTCRRIPGRLATVRRSIASGVDIDELLSTLPERESYIFEIEWRAAESCSEGAVQCLAAIAFLRDEMPVTELARIAGCASDAIIDELRRLHFLVFDERRKAVSYVSSGFRKYARLRLARFESSVFERAIQPLMEHPDDSESLAALPDYLERSRRISELAGYLTGQRVAAWTKLRRSISAATTMVARTSRLLQDAGLIDDAARFAVFQASMNDYMLGRVAKSRVEAAAFLGKESVAIGLANASVLDEERLHLLVLIAKRRKMKGMPEDKAVLDQIRQLAQTLDFSVMDDSAIEIATDLLLVAPDIAGVVLRQHAVGRNDANAIDRAISRMMLKTLAEESERSDVKSAFEVLDGVAGKEAPSELSLVAKGWSNESVESVLVDLGQLRATAEKTLLARIWLQAHEKSEGSVSVALAALDCVLEDTAYAPSATIFRDLARPLLWATEGEQAARLLTTLESQCPVTRKLGPVVDHFRFRFLLFRAGQIRSVGQGVGALRDDALEISELTDIATRATCLAWLLRTLDEAKATIEKKDLTELTLFAEDELNKAIERILVETADHVVSVRPILQALAVGRFRQAVDLAGRLNTSERCDAAYIVIARRLMTVRCDPAARVARTGNLVELMKLFTSTSAKQNLMCRVARWVGSGALVHEADSTCLDVARRLLDEIDDADERAVVCSYLMANESLAAVDPAIRASIHERIHAELHDVEDDWIRLNCIYNCVGVLADHQPLEANRLYEMAETEPRAEQARASGIATVRLLALLGGRLYVGLVKAKKANESDLSALCRLIDRLPSGIDQARLFGQFAMSIARFDREAAKRLGETRVRPLVLKLMRKDRLTSEERRLVIDVAPILWICHAASTLQQIDLLEPEVRADALNNVLLFVLEGRVPGEAWRTGHKQRCVDLDEDVLSDALTLLARLDRDNLLCYHVEVICEGLRSRRVATVINSSQKAAWVSRLRAITASKLPDRLGIRHDGYAVLCDAAFASVTGDRRPDWDGILDRIGKIPNLSDACYVATNIVPLVPSRFDDIRRQLFRLAVDTIPKLPTYEDRLMRVESLWSSCDPIYSVETRDMVKTVLMEKTTSLDLDIDERKRHLVEMVHRVDETWASSLVSAMDEEPARVNAREPHDNDSKTLDLQRRLRAREWEWSKEDRFENVAKACGRELGFLNATGYTSRGHADCEALVLLAGRYSLNEAYPVFAFAAESTVARYARTDQAEVMLRPLYGSVLEAASLLMLVNNSDPGRDREAVELLAQDDAGIRDLDVVIGVGERSAALDAVRRWLELVRPTDLLIIDPYFRAEDLDAVGLVQSVVPDCVIEVLTELASQKMPGQANQLEDAYVRSWRHVRAGAEPPDVTITIVGREGDGRAPIHDRWWISEDGGLDFGTSWNSLGGTKPSSIRAVGAREAEMRRTKVEALLYRKRRDFDGSKLVYRAFGLT